ncbi:DnaD domain protein [Fictibacillus sp. NRS-1165]|uniref:DnaD domain protein n=1 Tax=Fictibacillus sp. NRS-1165 TaxID=3144463 RepID=UPI003D22E17E
MLKRQVPFVMVDIAVIDDEEHLDIYDKMVFMIINRYAGNEDGKAWPSRPTIAKKARCSVDRVDKSIKNLMRLGLVRKEPRKKENGSNHSNVYEIPPMISSIPVSGFVPEQVAAAPKEEEKKISIYEVFYQTFGKVETPIQTQSMMQFQQEGLSDDLIIYGLEQTGLAGANFRYAEKIFHSWVKDGIRTIEQAKAAEQKYQELKKRPNRNQVPSKPMPEWLKEEEKKDDPKLNDFDQTAEEEANQKWLQELLKQG